MVHLVPSTEELAAELLLATWDDWSRYALSAPRVRLDRLSFAVNEEGHALVRGVPLPPIPGRRFFLVEGIGVPVGWKWAPGIDAASLRSALERRHPNAGAVRALDPGDLVLFTDEAGTWEVIPADAFVRASRSGLRATEEAIHG